MDQTSSNGTDIFVSRSTDNGVSWSPPLRVNDDPAGVANDQFNQWLAVDPSNGSVNLSWNDTRNDPARLSTDIFYALHRWRPQLHQERPGHHRSHQHAAALTLATSTATTRASPPWTARSTPSGPTGGTLWRVNGSDRVSGIYRLHRNIARSAAVTGISAPTRAS